VNIAGRILFDTNLINLTLDCGEFIFDGGEIPPNIPENAMHDVVALRAMFLTGQRASWQLAISPLTCQEIDATPDDDRRANLMRWFAELWLYWREFFEAEELSDEYADALARRLVDSDYLAPIPQPSDRVLVAHAIAYSCDGFCTRDRRTILRHREKVRGVPLRFLSPTEWRQEVAPYAGLFCGCREMHSNLPLNRSVKQRCLVPVAHCAPGARLTASC
jgi:hypothetical protein